MTIDGIHKFIHKKAENTIKKCTLKTQPFHSLAVDMNLLMKKMFSITNNKTEYNPISSIVTFLSNIRNNGINLFLVFDGKNRIGEKNKTLITRKKKIENKKIKLNDLVANANSVYDDLVKSKINNSDFITTVKTSETFIDLDILPISFLRHANKETISKLTKYNGYIKTIRKLARSIVDINIFIPRVKHILNILGFKTLVSSVDADFLIAHICEINAADAVLSDDGDFMAFECNYILKSTREKNESSDKIYEIYDRRAILNELNITSKQFTQICALSGTDFSKRKPKYGPIKLYNYIKNKNVKLFPNAFWEEAEGSKRAFELFTAKFKYNKDIWQSTLYSPYSTFMKKIFTENIISKINNSSIPDYYEYAIIQANELETKFNYTKQETWNDSLTLPNIIPINGLTLNLTKSELNDIIKKPEDEDSPILLAFHSRTIPIKRYIVVTSPNELKTRESFTEIFGGNKKELKFDHSDMSINLSIIIEV